MNKNVLVSIVALLSGVLFALGLGVSGMTRPDVVIGFLDVTGRWDPSLAFVMAGAAGVYFVAYRLITKRSRPVFSTGFQLPTRRDIDPRLVAGAALFGAGWGLGGICPGPGIVAATSLALPFLVFVGSMLSGMIIFRVWEARRAA